MTRLKRRLRIIFRRYGRRMASALLLVVLCWTATGAPIPAGKATQKNGELYPCATSQCGCASAEQCWSSCCCHTLSERLAWAREHGVEPPTFALAEAHNVGFDLSGLAESRGRGRPGSPENVSCCSKKSTPLAPAERTCCQKRTKLAPPESPAKKTNQYIVAWRALSCRGLAMNWLAVVPTVVEARPVWLDQPPCVAWLGPAGSDRADGLTDDPAVPPPERA